VLLLLTALLWSSSGLFFKLSSESTFFPWERRLSSAKAGDSGRDDRGGTPLPQRIITFFPE
jgi:hypothetical protein